MSYYTNHYPFLCQYVNKQNQKCLCPCWRESGCSYHYNKVCFVMCLGGCGKMTYGKYKKCNQCGNSERTFLKDQRRKVRLALEKNIKENIGKKYEPEGRAKQSEGRAEQPVKPKV